MKQKDITKLKNTVVRGEDDEKTLSQYQLRMASTRLRRQEKTQAASIFDWLNIERDHANMSDADKLRFNYFSLVQKLMYESHPNYFPPVNLYDEASVAQRKAAMRNVSDLLRTVLMLRDFIVRFETSHVITTEEKSETDLLIREASKLLKRVR